MVDGAIDPTLEAALKKLIKDAMKEELDSRLVKLDEAIASLQAINLRLDELEKSMNFTASRLDNIAKNMLPTLADHVARISEGLAEPLH